ncbi:MAG: glycosyltransferase WbuB, partial [Eggerthellaceae bacterium]|nr:glycosyltransferase WbuB [Eggerthellaceae bacterium]
MEGYYTYPDTTVGAPRKKRIAIVTQGVKLGDETRGYTRFRFIAQALAEAGFDVDLVTSTF